jgi:GrpB-like predicted nucleotidyltransferase (UPF0157 family)
VCALGSDWHRRHLLFRDWLRRSDGDRRLYGRAKEALARTDWPSMNDYADAKTAVIIEITERAQRWSERTDWSPESDS